MLIKAMAWLPPRHLSAARHSTHHRTALPFMLSSSGADQIDDTTALPALLMEAQTYFGSHGVELYHASTALPGSRTTSRVAVHANGDGLLPAAIIGMYKPHSHDVVPCCEDERCHAPHHPAINDAIDMVARELEAFAELSAYDERAKRGTLRYLQLSVERSSRQVQLMLVANAARLADDPAILRFANRLF